MRDNNGTFERCALTAIPFAESGPNAPAYKDGMNVCAWVARAMDDVSSFRRVLLDLDRARIRRLSADPPNTNRPDDPYFVFMMGLREQLIETYWAEPFIMRSWASDGSANVIITEPDYDCMLQFCCTDEIILIERHYQSPIIFSCDLADPQALEKSLAAYAKVRRRGFEQLVNAITTENENENDDVWGAYLESLG
jgi:hypothetical protein